MDEMASINLNPLLIEKIIDAACHLAQISNPADAASRR
jgi:hypothetical protein